MWYIYTMEYYSAIKNKWNNAICNNMDGPRDSHTKWSKSDRERQISYDITHMWNLIFLKNDTNELIYTTEAVLQISKTNLWLPKGKRWGEEINQELEMNIHTLLYIRQITNKDILYSTGNSTQYSEVTSKRKESKKEWIYVYV